MSLYTMCHNLAPLIESNAISVQLMKLCW